MHHKGRKFTHCPFSPSLDSLITWARILSKHSSLGTIFTDTLEELLSVVSENTNEIYLEEECGAENCTINWLRAGWPQ